MYKDLDLRILAPHDVRFDVTLGPFDVAWGPFDIAWQKLLLKNYGFDEILRFSGHLTSPEKKWAPVAKKIFYMYDILHPCPYL